MTVTATQVADKVREIGTREPDVNYHDLYQEITHSDDVVCQYVLNAGPGCIVGKALIELGVEIEDLQVLDSSNHGGGTAAKDIPESIIEWDSLDARAFIQDVQESQDGGDTWGEAINEENH